MNLKMQSPVETEFHETERQENVNRKRILSEIKSNV